MKKEIGVITGAFLLAVGVWSAPALAGGPVGPLAQVCNDEVSACSYDYDGWIGVAAQDNARDDTGVYANYYRNSGGKQVLNNYNGYGTETRSGGDSNNRVARHRACANYTGPDSCSSYVYR